MKIELGVLIVTYNRVEKLKTTLDLIDSQTEKPKYVIVYDNASTDETFSYLSRWKEQMSEYTKYIIQNNENTGGSGGFYSGLEYAKTLDADWIWVSDDDAFPELDAFEKVMSFLNSRSDLSYISAICGKVINNEKIDLVHRRNAIQKGYKVILENCSIKQYEEEYFKLNCCSYVGMIINKDKLNQVGSTIKDYFIWADDAEHSLRLSEVGDIYCVPSIAIHHDTESSFGFSWKTYYGVRNTADMYKRHFPKYCYHYYCFHTLIKSYIHMLKRKNRQKCLVYIRAIRDAKRQKFGIHQIYRPGWKPEE